MKKFPTFIWETGKIVVLALLIVLPIRYFVFQPFLVVGQSMEPNFSQGDYLIVDEISYRFREPKRGEVIVFKYPNNPSQRFIKRVIALPGETIEIREGEIIIEKGNQKFSLDESDYLSEFMKIPINFKTSLAEDEYFVLGDNRSSSFDSRRWGPLKREYIIGRVIFRLWPFSALAKFETPVY